MSLLNCANCGGQNPEGSVFCMHCGNNLTIGEKKMEDPDLSVPGQTPGSTTGADVLPADNETAADVASQPEDDGVPPSDEEIQADTVSQPAEELQPGIVPQQGHGFQPGIVTRQGQGFQQGVVPQQGQGFQPGVVPQQGQGFQQGIAVSTSVPQKKSLKKLWIILASVFGGILIVTGLTLTVIFVVLPGIKYNNAMTALNEQRFDEAYQAFIELDDYKDSQTMVKETLYYKALYLLAKKQYKESMAVFNELGDYKDSSTQYQNAYYAYGLDLLDQEAYLDAAEVFKYLGDYSDSKDQYKLAYYKYGKQLIKEESFEDAITVFESLGNYSDSKKLLKKAKYGYVVNHMDNTDLVTYEYLKELKSANYEKSKKLYESLYAWKLKNIHFSDSEDNSMTMKAISKYDAIYCHFELTGGPPDGSTYLYCKATWPDGSSSSKIRSNDKYSPGLVWWAWQEGIYNDPEYGETGTFTLVFYDGNKKVIGKGSVRIVD